MSSTLFFRSRKVLYFFHSEPKREPFFSFFLVLDSPPLCLSLSFALLCFLHPMQTLPPCTTRDRTLEFWDAASHAPAALGVRVRDRVAGEERESRLKERCFEIGR